MPNSQDIFLLVLSLCAVWFTIFLCWVLFQAASLLKRVHVLVDEVKVKIEEIEDTILSMKSKFDGNMAIISTIADGVKNIIEVTKRITRKDEE